MIEIYKIIRKRFREKMKTEVKYTNIKTFSTVQIKIIKSNDKKNRNLKLSLSKILKMTIKSQRYS
jgi:hypothetical protein